MKRAISTTAATLAGFGAVLGLHSAANKTRTSVAVPPPASAGTTTTTAPPSANSSSGGSSSGRPIGPQAPTTTLPPGQSRTITGTSENYGYGILSVKLTMAGSRISDVGIAGLQVAESYSQMIAQQVVPMLRHEVLTAQSTNVSTISGATYTSEAYLASVQSALDKARA